MGAYLVSRRHIDTLVGAALEIAHESDQPFRYDVTEHMRITLTRAAADGIGQRLWETNLNAYLEYYHQTGYGDLRNEIDDYRYHEPSDLVDASIGSLLKAVHSYVFQAASVSTWDRSEAKAFCDALVEGLIVQLDEYQDAPWVIDDYVQEPLLIEQINADRIAREANTLRVIK